LHCFAELALMGVYAWGVPNAKEKVVTTNGPMMTNQDIVASDLLETLTITRICPRDVGGGSWVKGTMGGHRFEALVFPEHADQREHELEGDSRISKLWVHRHHLQAARPRLHHHHRSLPRPPCATGGHRSDAESHLDGSITRHRFPPSQALAAFLLFRTGSARRRDEAETPVHSWVSTGDRCFDDCSGKYPIMVRLRAGNGSGSGFLWLGREPESPTVPRSRRLSR